MLQLNPEKLKKKKGKEKRMERNIGADK